MKFCTTCRMRFWDEHLFCPLDRTFLLRDEVQEGVFDLGPEAPTLVFRSLPDPEQPIPEQPISEQPEPFDPDSRTGAWFAEGEDAEQELASATPSRPLPGIYSRALEEEADRPSPLRHIPWAIGAGVAGIYWLVYLRSER